MAKAALSFAILAHVINIVIIKVYEKIQRFLAPKIFHDRKDTNFLKGLKYFAEKPEIDEKYFYEAPLLVRKLYEYRVYSNDDKRVSFNTKELYGSISYFSGKTTAINLKLLNSSNFLKFLIKKKSLRNN